LPNHTTRAEKREKNQSHHSDEWRRNVMAERVTVPVRHRPYNKVQTNVMGDAGASSVDVIRHDVYPDRISYRIRVVLSTEEKVATSLCEHQFNHLHDFVNTMLQCWTNRWVRDEAHITQILAEMGPLNDMGVWNALSGTEDLIDDLADLRLQEIDALADFVAVT
jgi:hypothetical protein